MSTVSAAAAISISNFPSICRPVLAYSGTAQRSSYSRCFHPSVSRPAALPKLNLRGRCPVIVPANGCLAKLLLWSRNQVEGSSPPSQRFGNSQVQGNLRIPLTSTYHGCLHFPCPRLSRARVLLSAKWLEGEKVGILKSVCPNVMQVVRLLRCARTGQRSDTARRPHGSGGLGVTA